jgi:hypothetical protein
LDQSDLELRNATYQLFVELGRAPSIDELAAARGQPVDVVRDGWRRLHEAHALVLDEGTTELLMANPFAAQATDFRVYAGDRTWFGNCAWDAFGIGAALGVDSVIETVCPDCSDPIQLSVTAGVPDDLASVFHVLVPAAQWWNDITHT